MIKRIKLLGLFLFLVFWFEQINNVLKYWTLIWKCKNETILLHFGFGRIFHRGEIQNLNKE